MSIIQGYGYQRREHWEHLRSAKRRMTVGSSDHMASHRTKARNAETKINREFKSKVFWSHSTGIQIKIIFQKY